MAAILEELPERDALVGESSGQLSEYLVTGAALEALRSLPVAPPNDRVFASRNYRQLMDRLERELDETIEQPPPARTGTLTTDGTFLTIEVGERREHFVLAEGGLPGVAAEPIVAPDGSLVLTLSMPGGEQQAFTVAGTNVVSTEKALLMLRKATPTATIGPAAALPPPSAPPTEVATTWWESPLDTATVRRPREER
ncbi:MAG: hypothetical protein QM733_01965 [Ilumatobacteraceae bacterium]